jgi:hypothetical protein
VQKASALRSGWALQSPDDGICRACDRLAQQEGGRRVFEREGTVLADEAAGLSAANAAGFFVPGMVNREFGARVEEGRRQQPLAAFAGDVAGGFGPGEIIGAGVSKAVQAIGPGMAALGRMFKGKPAGEPPMVLGPQDEVLDLTVRALPDRITEDVKIINRRNGVRPGETRLQAAERRWAKARKEGRLWDDGSIPDNERVEYWLDELGRRYDRKDEIRKMVGEIYRRIDDKLGPDAKGSAQRNELATKRLRELADKLEKGDLPPRGGGAVLPFPSNPSEPSDPITELGFAALGRMFSGQKISPEMQSTLQQTAMGSIGGSAYGNFNDVNQDGVIDQKDVYAGAVAGGVGLPATVKGAQVASDFMPAPRAAPRVAPDAMPAGGYFGRQSMRPPGSGPSPREIEIQQQWSTATPIVTQARTTAQTAQQAAEAALQSKAPADIARAKAEKKALVGQLQEAQASRAGMDTPEDARLAETLASLTENTSDPVLLSTQISAAKTSLDRLLTDIGSPVEGNLIPVKTNILTRTQAPRSAAEGPQDRASVTRYAEGSDEVKPQGFGAGGPKQGAQAINDEYFNLLKQGKRREALRLLHKERGVTLVDSRIDRGGMHSPPSASDGAPGYDVASNGIFPDDLYSANGRRYYGTGDDTIDGPAFDVIKSMEASPNKMITIYRSVEKGASGKINPGDWVTTVRKYAKDHGEANIGSDFKIIKKTVAARDIFTDGNSIAEWGYSPQPMLPSHRGAYTEDLKRIPGEWKPIYAPDDDIKPMGFGASPPKTPQQAARFETPGSPEYEAAVAKGLDMSQAGRMARAKEMGFDTETVLYHGTDKEIASFRPSERGAFGPGVYLSDQSGVASRYGKPSPYYVRGSILDTRPGKPLPKGLSDAAKSQLTPEEVQRWERLWPQRNSMAVDAETFREVLTRSVEAPRVPEIMRRLGFDGMQGIADGHELVIFDPANIRSVNAAFDPEKSTSSTLLAASPFAAVGGAGLTSERELGSKMQRDKKD